MSPPLTDQALLREGVEVAPVEVCDSRASRRRGLLGRDGIGWALLLPSTSSVHTVGMRFAIDVAYCDRDLVVVRTATMRPNRLGRPTLHARAVIEAEAGAFARWGLAVGDHLAVRSPGESPENVGR